MQVFVNGQWQEYKPQRGKGTFWCAWLQLKRDHEAATPKYADLPPISCGHTSGKRYDEHCEDQHPCDRCRKRTAKRMGRLTPSQGKVEPEHANESVQLALQLTEADQGPGPVIPWRVTFERRDGGISHYEIKSDAAGMRRAADYLQEQGARLNQLQLSLLAA